MTREPCVLCRGRKLLKYIAGIRACIGCINTDQDVIGEGFFLMEGNDETTDVADGPSWASLCALHVRGSRA